MIVRTAPVPLLLLLVPVAAAVGCAGPSLAPSAAVPLVMVRASSDLDCPQSDIRLQEELGGSFKAVGCGRKARYHAACDHLSCVVQGEDEPMVPSLGRPEPGGLDAR